MKLLLAAVALFVLSGDLNAAGAARPNFLFILCDDLGYGDLGCFGHPVIQTPNLDRLASQGMKLTHCYAAAPVCSPSRAGIMTGRNPNRAGIRDWIPANSGVYLKKDEVTVARLLQEAGYRTAVVGKWHLNSKLDGSEPTPADHGFQYWFVTQNNAGPNHQNPVNFVRNGKAAGPLKGNSSTLIVDEAIQFLRQESQPFFVYLCFHAPHEIVATPIEFTRKYAAEPDEDKRIYYGSVALVDHEVGRLLQTLDELKLRENTLVLFTSDNGPETHNRYKTANHSHGSPGPFRGMKLHMYEGGYRVPGIIHWPGKTRRGMISEEPICGVDVLPTFCELAAAKPPEDRAFDGVSFLPILDGKPLERKKPLYWQYDKAIGGPNRVALRHGQWKLLGNADLDRFELYDLAADPGEKNDLATLAPRRAAELATRMRELHGEINRR